MNMLPHPKSLTHPCFNKAAAGTYGRMHLPVAPRCNIQCNFCDRRYDCVNESRPGITSAVLKPFQALEYTRRMLEKIPAISVAGIAGPGDPMANPAETLETLRLLHEEFPQLLFCLSSNGLALAPYARELAELGVSHVTITLNAVDPGIGARIYSWVRDGNVLYRGEAAAGLLLERQLASLEALRPLNMVVKVNTIVIPGVNDMHIQAVAETAKAAGASLHNLMPLLPAAGTPFGGLTEPAPDTMRKLRAVAGGILPQMTHCRRCRADAVGLLGHDRSGEMAGQLAGCGCLAPTAQEDRPYVAVATREGTLVNLHLGEAKRFQVWGRAPSGGFRLVEEREAPAMGHGPERWNALSHLLADCRVLLVSALGDAPLRILAERGPRPVIHTGLICDALPGVYGEQGTLTSHGLTGTLACPGNGL